MADVKIRYVGVDDASDETRKVADGIKGIESAAGSAQGGVSGFFKNAFSFVTGGLITSALSSVTGAVGGLVSGMVDGNAEFERYEVQFGVLLKSTDKAKERLAELAKFGAETPFDLPEVVKADKILQGFGLESEESAAKFGKSGAEIRRIAGDVAAGTGASFEDMALLIGKLSAGASGEAISRMAELGIASKEELAKMGLEFDKGGALLSPLPQAMQVVTDLMQQKFGGMMDKQSQTFEGMTSNFNDWIQGTIRAAGAPIFDKVKEGLGSLLTLLNSEKMQAAISGIANMVGNVLGGAIGAAIPIINSLILILGTLATDGLGALFKNLGDGSSYFTSFLEKFGLSEAMAGKVNAAFSTVSSAISSVGSMIEAVVDVVTNSMGNGDGLAGTVNQAVTSILLSLGVFGDDAEKVGQMVGDTVNKMGVVFETVKATISQVLGAVTALVGAELAVVVKFFNDHGAEIMADVKKTFDSILEIITLALQLIQRTIVPLLKAIATFISQHGTEIGNVFKAAWDVISGIVDVAITVIKGILTVGLALIKGDTQGALNGVKDMFTHIWDDIKGIVQGAWNFIANIVKLAGEAIAKLTGQQNQATGIQVSFNPGYAGGVQQGAGPGNNASGSISMAGDTYNVGNSDVAQQIQRARKQATQAALLRATVGS